MGDSNDTRELIKMTLDVRESIARLDAKVDQLSEIRRTAEGAEKSAQKAHGRLDSVVQRLDDNDEKWREDRVEKRWIWGLFISTIVAVGTATLSILL